MSDDQDTKICPFCAETIKKAAKVCRFCGRDLPQDETVTDINSKENAVDSKKITNKNNATHSKSKIIIYCFIFLLLAGCGCIWGYQKTQTEHFMIKLANDYLRSQMKSPSSYKFKKAIFEISNGYLGGETHQNIPIMTIEFEAQNSFGASLKGEAKFYFGHHLYSLDYDKLEKISLDYKMFDMKNQRLKDGIEQLTPFEDLDVFAITVDGKEINTILWLSSTVSEAREKYKGPKIGGKVIKFSPFDKTVECEFTGRKIYYPDKFIHYQ